MPLSAVKLWTVREAYAGLPFAQDVSEDVRTFAASLSAPYCGPNAGFEAAQWLTDAQMVQSLAFVGLTAPEGGQSFGLLVLGSPDPQRFGADMGTSFLGQIGQIASAALHPLVV